jgi:hypothetical protein
LAGKTFPWTSPKGPFGTECGSFFREKHFLESALPHGNRKKVFSGKLPREKKTLFLGLMEGIFFI